MGFCPFLSLRKIKEIDFPEPPDIGDVVYDLNITEHTCPQNATCQLWGTTDCALKNAPAADPPPASSASALIMEFLNKADSDGVSFTSLGVVGSIYGTDFMIYEADPDNLPPVLKSIHNHPDFKTDDIVDLANSNCSVSVIQDGTNSMVDWEYEITAIDGTTDFVADGITTDMYVYVESESKAGTITNVLNTVLEINMGAYDDEPLVDDASYFFIAGRKRISFAEFESAL